MLAEPSTPAVPHDPGPAEPTAGSLGGSPDPSERPLGPWWRDPWLWGALAVAVVLRALPLLVWGWASDDCTRDECIYKIVARPILQGEGLAPAPKQWLPAPGFPYLMAACHALFGRFEAVKWVHVALSVPTTAVMYGLGWPALPDAAATARRRAGRLLAFGFAVHPTFVFFAGTMWTETVYTALITAAALAMTWARSGGVGRALLPGVLLGLCVLNRGVATYLAPLFVAALVAPEVLGSSWDTWRAALRRRWRHGAAFVLGALITVAPYSISASQRWGGVVITDATLGHVMALGNDDYPPVTFDYMNGQLTGRLYGTTLRSGRRDCPQRRDPLAHDRCEVDRSLEWIREHPGTFVSRIPMRLAQLFNPHSFLTRHLRWDFWPGIPWALKEALVVLQVLSTALIVLGGTFAAFARARGPLGLLGVGLLAYHVSVIAALYGLTRFRLPLEPFWMLFLAAFLATPAASWARLRARPARALAAVLLTAVLAWLMKWYLWTGFPGA